MWSVTFIVARGVIGYPPVLWHFKAPLGSLSQHLTCSGAPPKGRLGAQRIHSSASGLFVCVNVCVNVCVERQRDRDKSVRLSTLDSARLALRQMTGVGFQVISE